MATNYAAHPQLAAAPPHAWFVHYETTSNDNEQITYADGLTSPIETATIGEELSLPLVFYPSGRKDDPPPNDRHIERYREFLDLAKFAGQHTTFPTRTNARTERNPDGTEYTAEGLLFTESVPETAGSLLLKAVPGYQTARTDGLWLLLDALTDETMLENTVCQVEISTTVVGWVSDYDDRASFVQDMRYEGI